jgi:hypothetical protein
MKSAKPFSFLRNWRMPSQRKKAIRSQLKTKLGGLRVKG